MAQKGLINIQDYILPLDRFEISNALNKLKQESSKLTKIGAKELDFLLQEFYVDNLLIRKGVKM